MTIFDYIKDIIVDKTGALLIDSSYSPYLINRWLSFINPVICEHINSTNRGALLEDKELHYKTMLCMFPQMKRCPRISYIKKNNEEKTEKDNEQKIKNIAGYLEISKREAAMLVSSSEYNS